MQVLYLLLIIIVVLMNQCIIKYNLKHQKLPDGTVYYSLLIACSLAFYMRNFRTEARTPMQSITTPGLYMAPALH